MLQRKTCDIKATTDSGLDVTSFALPLDHSTTRPWCNFKQQTQRVGFIFLRQKMEGAIDVIRGNVENGWTKKRVIDVLNSFCGGWWLVVVLFVFGKVCSLSVVRQ